MKKLIIIGISIFFLLPSVVVAGQRFGKDPEKFKERLVTIRNWKLMEEFDLSGEKAQKVFNILKRYDEQRETLIIQRRKSFNELKKEVGRVAPSEKRLKDLVREITKTNVELARLPAKQLEGLKDVFSVKESARYLLFSERFGRNLQNVFPRGGPDRRNRFQQE